jgi:hypothetical protein
MRFRASTMVSPVSRAIAVAVISAIAVAPRPYNMLMT